MQRANEAAELFGSFHGHANLQTSELTDPENRSLNFVHLDMRATVENYATSQWGVGIMLVVLHGNGIFRISKVTNYKTNEFGLRGR